VIVTTYIYSYDTSISVIEGPPYPYFRTVRGGIHECMPTLVVHHSETQAQREAAFLRLNKLLRERR
jgi:hypothetical protein